jgi:hypothetical protein
MEKEKALNMAIGIVMAEKHLPKQERTDIIKSLSEIAMQKELELADTIVPMLSSDYKERFKAEYYQLRIRTEKLENFIDKYEDGELDFTPDCSVELLQQQLEHMNEYLSILGERANIEGVDL